MSSRLRVGFVLLAFASLMCHQSILTAPPGSTIEVFANPEHVRANGGVSIITAFVRRADNIPVADGTVVQFFTNLGRIDEQGKTNDGVARVNFVSDSRSGDACISAFSGGGTGGGGGSSSTSIPTTTSTVASSPTAESVWARAAGSGCQVTVHVGTPDAKTIIVTAFPQRLTDQRASLITANVFDGDGNPVASVPVIFTVEPGSGGLAPASWLSRSYPQAAPAPNQTTTTTTSSTTTTTTTTLAPQPADLTEFMDSQGTPTFTNNNGQAQDVMRSRYPRDGEPKTVTVRATTPNGTTSTVTVYIN